jgi:hypothetical protein
MGTMRFSSSRKTSVAAIHYRLLAWLVLLLLGTCGCSSRQAGPSPTPASTTSQRPPTPKPEAPSASPPTPSPAPRTTVTPTAPVNSPIPTMTPSPVPSAQPTVNASPVATADPVLQRLTPDGWETTEDGLDVLPNMYRTTGPMTLSVAGGGRIHLSGDTKIRIGPEKKSFKLIEGSLVIQAREQELHLFDEFGTEVRVKDGKLVAKRFPDRMEYRSIEGIIVTKSLGKTISDDMIDKSLQPGTAFFTNGLKAGYVRGGTDAQLGAFMMLANEDVANEIILPMAKLPPSEAGLSMIQDRGPDVFNPRKGLFAPKRPPSLKIKRPRRIQEDNWNREISWRLRPPQTKVTGYFVRLYRQLEDSEPVLLWSAVSEFRDVDVPDYVETPLGLYRVTVHPMVGRDLVDLEGTRQFELVKEKEKPAPKPPQPSGETVVTVERVQKQKRYPRVGPSRHQWEAVEGFGIRHRYSLSLPSDQILQGRLAETGTLILAGPGNATFTLPKGPDDGAVIRLLSGSLWAQLNGGQKRFTVVTSLGMVKVAGEPTEFAVTSNVRTGQVFAIKGQVVVTSSGRDYPVKEGQIFDLKTRKVSTAKNREDGLSKVDFSSLPVVSTWISELE